MDGTLPVARRTRSNQDRFYREVFENIKATKKKKKMKKKKKKEEKRSDDVSDEEESSSGRDSDFEMIAGGSDRDDNAEGERVCRGGKGSQATRGTMENPLCIESGEDDDDSDDHGDGDYEEELKLSSESESGEGSSDKTYEVSEEEAGDRRRRRGRGEEREESDVDESGDEDVVMEKERQRGGVKRTEKKRKRVERERGEERVEGKSGRGVSDEGDSDSDSEGEGVGFWMIGEEAEMEKEQQGHEKSTKKKMKKRMGKERAEKRVEGNSGHGVSDDSEDVGFWMIDEEVVMEKERRGHEKKKKKERMEREMEEKRLGGNSGNGARDGFGVSRYNGKEEEDEEREEEEGREKSTKKKKKKKKKIKGNSGYGVSDDSDGDSEDVGFWMIDEEVEMDKERRGHEKNMKKKKKKRMGREREKERPGGNSGNGARDGFGVSRNNGKNEKKEKEEREMEGTNVEAAVSESELDEMEESSSEKSGDESEACVARRTRSRSSDGRGEKKKKKKKKELVGFGTESRPLCFEEEEDEGVNAGMGGSCSEEEMLPTPAKKKRKCDTTLGGGRGKEPEKGKGKAAKGKKGRRQREINVTKILLDSMSKNGEMCLEELAADKNVKESETVLPLKFTFRAEKPDLPEKTDFEREVEKLWSEFHILLASEEIGVSSTNNVESELDEDQLCKMGKHRTHILNEQIGLICKNCSDVILEIKYIVPSFIPNPSGRSDFCGFGKGDYSSLFDAFGHEDSDCNYALSDTELRARAKTVWDMIPGVRAKLYPHQREGFEFIWKHVAGGIQRENFENIESFAGGRGCIISHAPGTGKSLLTIIFLQSYMKLHPKCLPVIIAPSSMLLTWEEEFKKWKVDIPFHNLNSRCLSGKEDKAAMNILRHAHVKDNDAVRIVKLYSWEKGGSLLGVSYSTFEKMAGAQKDAVGERIRRFLLDLPGLVVLDEGHIPRNENSLIWQALSYVKTQKRILLSGTPFQNNFNELYNTMRVVNPRFSGASVAPAVLNGGGFGSKRESQLKARRDWISLTKPLGKDGDFQNEAARLKKIKSFIDPFVHIHKGDVLEKSLPGLLESIVVLKPSELQARLLQGIPATKKEQLQLERAVSLISVHPSLSLDLTTQSFPINTPELQALRLRPNAGVKTKFLMGLIRLCAAINERVLVFSQYIDPLSLVMEQLKSEFNWNENTEVLYIDGKRDMKERQSAINNFNDPKSKAKVLLVSTKAGGEGINLVGASRVVLLDVVWNPSVERQATRRAYRLGQQKFVYIYHLVASGTMEEEKHSRQAEKDRLSKLVFSSSSARAGNYRKESPDKVGEDRVLEEMVRHELLKDMFANISIKNKDCDPAEQQAWTSLESDL